MKKNNIKWIFNDHSTERFFDRTALNITKKDIAKAITNNQILPFKRINTSRSMCYIHVKKEVIKTVMHKKKNKIITILPWNSIFQFKMKFHIKKYNNIKFKINIFPDCYLETKTPNALTKIYERVLHMDGTFGWEKIRYDHPLFNEVFNIAWSNFSLVDLDHISIQEERDKGNETFEIAGKAKEVDSFLDYI